MFRDMFSGSRALFAGLVFFVLAVGGSILYSQHVQRTSQEKLARTHAAVQHLGHRDKNSVSQLNVQPTEMTNVLETETHNIAPVEAPGSPPVHTSEASLEAPQEVVSSPESEAIEPDVDASETLYFGDYTKEDLIQIRDWAKALEANLLANYSELAALTHMTPEEIAEKYPTEVDRKRLAELAKDMFNFYGEEIAALMHTLPAEMREAVKTHLHHQLTHNWGSEAANKVMSVLGE